MNWFMTKLNHQIKKIKRFYSNKLLVVVAIIGALAAVGVIAYNGYTSAAKRNARLNHSQAIKFIKVNLLYVNYRQAVLWSLAQPEQLIVMQKMMQAELIL